MSNDGNGSEQASADDDPEEGGRQPAAESGRADVPFRATLPEKIAAIFVLTLMGAALVFVAWTVILYWGQVGV